MSSVEVRIVSGGDADPLVEAAIHEAVARALTTKERVGPRRTISAWASAARLEAVGSTVVRSRALLPPA